MAVTLLLIAAATVVLAGVLANTRRVHLDGWQITAALLIVALGLSAGSIPPLVAPAQIARIPLALLLLFFSIRGKNFRLSGWHSRLLVGTLGACAVLATLSTAWSYNRVETLLQSLLFAVMAISIFGLLASRWRDEDRVYSDLRVLYWTTATILTSGAVIATFGADFALGFDGRAQGFFGNANMQGYLSAITLALGISIWSRGGGWPLIATNCVLGYSVIISESRTALVATAVGLVWYYVTSSAVAKAVAGWLGALLLTLGALAVSLRSEYARLLQDALFPRFTAEAEVSSLNGRSGIWSAAWEIGSSNFAGIGFGSTTEFIGTYSHPALTGHKVTSAHSSYLQWFVETGAVGLIPFAALLWTLLVLIVRKFPHPWVRALTVVPVVGSVLHIAESMIFGNGQIYPWLFWTSVAALAALRDFFGDDRTMTTEPIMKRRRGVVAA